MNLYEKVKNAARLDPSIVVMEKDLKTHPGFDQTYFELLGLSRTDLRALERKGLAIRGYSKNVWGPGETTPDGFLVAEDTFRKGTGHRVKWLIIAGGSDAQTKDR